MDETIGNQQATDAELGWLAGIIDGEGWIGFSVYTRKQRGSTAPSVPQQVKVEIKITNCDQEIIDKSVAILEKLGVNAYRRSTSQTGIRRTVHECATKHMATVERVLEPILPHLVGIKKHRAHLMLEFIVSRRNTSSVVRPGYDDGVGPRGQRTCKPYTPREIELIETCRHLQSTGASETTREKRERAIKAALADHAQEYDRQAASRSL